MVSLELNAATTGEVSSPDVSNDNSEKSSVPSISGEEDVIRDNATPIAKLAKEPTGKFEDPVKSTANATSNSEKVPLSGSTSVASESVVPEHPQSASSSNDGLTGVKETIDGPSNGKLSCSTSDTSESAGPEHPQSASSSNDALTGVKETIDGPNTGKFPLFTAIDKAVKPYVVPLPAGGERTVQIPASDSASMGSIPSVLDSVGAATLAEQRLNAPQGTASMQTRFPSQITPQSTPVAGPINPPSVDDPPLHDIPPEAINGPQHIGQGSLVSQTPPLLVAVPFQQSTNHPGVLPQQPPSSTTASQERRAVYANQTPATVLYQIPGLVTLPVGATPEGRPTEREDATAVATDVGCSEVSREPPQSNHLQPPIQAIAQSQDQIVGMVGAIPIVKLQGGTLHLVKKKKGRFNFLQDTPAVPAVTNVAVGTSPGTAFPAVTPQNIVAPVQGAPNMTVPSNIAFPASSQVANNSSSGSQVSGPLATAPLTFDGTSVPKVKKKGRFVVTNVKDPVSIPKNIQSQPSAASLASQDGTLPVPPPQQPQPNPQQSQQVQPPQQHSTPQPIVHQNIPSQATPPQVIAQLSLPATIDSNTTQIVSQQPVQSAAEGPTAIPYSAPAGLAPQQVPAPPNVQPAETLQPSQAQVLAKQQNGPVDQLLMPQNTPIPLEQGLSSNLNSTPPPTPMVLHGKESPGPRQPQVPTLPNASIPKAPQLSERVASLAASKKAPQKRPGKPPQSIGSNGIYGNIGLGKLSYFLDQMKSEVTEADRTIKHFQTDMKILRDKNKELEAKNRELERKLKEEISLREKAEARCMEFRKKLRELAKSEPLTAAPKDKAIDECLRRTNSVDRGIGNSDTIQTAKQTLGQKETLTANVQPIMGSKENKDTGTNLVLPSTPSKGCLGSRSLSSEQAVRAAQGSHEFSSSAQAKSKAPSPVRPVGMRLDDLDSKEKATMHGRSNSSGSGSKESDLGAMNRPQAEGKMKMETPRTPNAKRASISTPRRGDGVSLPAAAPQSQPTAVSVPSQSIHPTQNMTLQSQSTIVSRQQQQDSASTISQQPQHQRPPPSSWPGNGQNAASTPKAVSIRQFDPLRQDADANLDGDVVPVFSIPTNVSLGAMPIGPTTSIFQNPAGQTYSAAAAPFGQQFNQAAFVSENPYVVPITFGMASSTVGSTVAEVANSQQPMNSSFQMQQPIMLQQPIMFHHEWAPSVHQSKASNMGQAINQQSSHSQHQQYSQTIPSNPFDPFS